MGLNRTSVGLKLSRRSRRRIGPSKPQSNQRGIETPPPPPAGGGAGFASIEPAWD